jgi:radical SAM superfamily enzyme YgiQ (UPF0313 family)|tara:strand:- start:8572 stop:10068 length:1497 start_codon:yes stop_codon:yes gene_type:complete
MIQTLIYSIPPLDTTKPPLSGALLASVCGQLGHDCIAVDLQVNLNLFLENQNIDANCFDNVFYDNETSFSTHQLDILNLFIDNELARFCTVDYDYILVSFFSYLSQHFGRLFLKKLRSKTKATILIGGAGIETLSNGPFFAEELKKLKYIDEYIVGEAEEILPVYFETKSGPGIGNKNFKQIENLDLQVFPNYSYYDLTKYKIENKEQELTIIGSRGCVRKCKFCDVEASTPKYKFRSGANIAKEIIGHYEKHGVTRFYFADSLVNGSYKAFNDMCHALAGYQFEKPISWSGQYIVRSKDSTPKDHFKLLKQSGCSTLFIGIESGSDRVRADLGKKFTNDDIEYYLENFYQHDIQTLFLFFTGYVSETEQDHAETLQMFKRWQKYVATGTIQGIETLNILGILPGSPLNKIAKNENYLFLTDHNGLPDRRGWINPSNPGFDFKQRVQRHIEMMEQAMKYHWPLWNGHLSIDLYERALLKFIDLPKKYIPIMPSSKITQ